MSILTPNTREPSFHFCLVCSLGELSFSILLWGHHKTSAFFTGVPVGAIGSAFGGARGEGSRRHRVWVWVGSGGTGWVPGN